jgi:hypothetical protein
VQGFVGIYDAISSEDTIRASAAVVSRTKGKGIVVTTVPPPPFTPLPDGVETKMVSGASIVSENKGSSCFDNG